MSDCPHIHLIKLAGPMHEGGKDYLCQDCKDLLRVEIKPLEIEKLHGEAFINALDRLLKDVRQEAHNAAVEKACESVQKAIDIWKTWETDDGYEAIQTALGIMERIRSLRQAAGEEKR